MTYDHFLDITLSRGMFQLRNEVMEREPRFLRKFSHLDPQVRQLLANCFNAELKAYRDIRSFKERFISETTFFDLKSIFQAIDTDNSGALDKREMQEFMNQHSRDLEFTFEESVFFLRRFKMKEYGFIDFPTFENFLIIKNYDAVVNAEQRRRQPIGPNRSQRGNA